VKQVREIAVKQELIFDDRYIGRGIIVVGNRVEGQATTLIVGLKRDGEKVRLIHNLSGAGWDTDEGYDMRDRFLRALQRVR